MNFDVFNGDADGIISLTMLRRAKPLDAELVTGRKRDIALLERVEAGEGDSVTVLDISMKSNGAPLRRILDAGAKVFYADHHNAGDIPRHPLLIRRWNFLIKRAIYSNPYKTDFARIWPLFLQPKCSMKRSRVWSLALRIVRR